MIKTYKNSEGGKVKVFFTLDDDGNIASVKMGNRVVPMQAGYQFYVDDHVAKQIDKVDIDFVEGKPTLKVKDGETLDVSQKTEREKEIERLEKELAELKSAE